MKKRNLALALLFSIITFGIYAIYWFVCLTNDSNAINPPEATASAGMAILFNMITLGIYGFYWHYKLGVKLKGHGGLYLIIFILGFGWINFLTAQSEINKRIA